MKMSMIGALLRKLRILGSLSQRELERRAGIAHGHWGYIESGERLPTISLVAKALPVLGLAERESHIILALTLRERLQHDVDDYKQALHLLPPYNGTITLGHDTPAELQERWEDWSFILKRENLVDTMDWNGLRLVVEDPEHNLTIQWLG